VVTAAHCTEGLSAQQFTYYVKVYVGVEDLTKAIYSSKNKYNISQLIKHEGFVMQTKNNDIALIKLQRPIETIDNDTMPAW
jgi:secreted trypsin-like serine protease